MLSYVPLKVQLMPVSPLGRCSRVGVFTWVDTPSFLGSRRRVVASDRAVVIRWERTMTRRTPVRLCCPADILGRRYRRS